jgi:MFS family permease
VRPPARALFTHRPFRALLRVRLLGQLADGLLQAGLVGVVLFAPEQAPSPTRIVLGFSMLLLPFCLVAPLAGVLLDRWSRVRALTWANVARAGLLAVTALATAARVGDALVFGAALLALGLNRIVLAALGAGLPRTLPGPLLVSGNALAPTLGTVATVVGAGTGLVLRGMLEQLGDAAPFAVAVVGYLLAAGSAAVFGVGDLGPDRTERRAEGVLQSAWSDVVVGAQQLWRIGPARRSLLLMGAQRICFGALTLWTVTLIRFRLSGTSSDEEVALAALGAVALMVGLGLLVAASVTPTLVRHRGARRTASVALATASVGALLPIAGERLGSILLLWLLVGLGAQAVKITLDTVLQRSVHDSLRGRVFMAYDIVFNVAFVGGAAVVASVPAATVGVTTPLVVGVGYAALAMGVRADRRS